MKKLPPVLTLAGLVLAGFAGLVPELAAADALPIVAVAPVKRETLARQINLQAEFRPYEEIDLHAKVSGYLQKINVDIGDRVKAGDLIAVIEVPELRDELAHAVAAAKKAEVDQRAAHLDYTRMLAVNKSQPNLVAQQDIDLAEEKDDASEAAKTAADAEVQRYRTMIAYTEIRAPFGGTITARYVDPGTMIQTGGTSAALVRLSEIDRLRLVAPVSVSYAGSVKTGDPVTVLLEGDAVAGTWPVSRFSHRISMQTRTMEVQVDLPNQDQKFIPGMYATVVLKVDAHENVLAIPVLAVSAGKKPTVFVVNDKGLIEERAVKLGLETPDVVEVVSGVREGERVMIGNRTGVAPGQQVAVKQIAMTTEGQ